MTGIYQRINQFLDNHKELLIVGGLTAILSQTDITLAAGINYGADKKTNAPIQTNQNYGVKINKDGTTNRGLINGGVINYQDGKSERLLLPNSGNKKQDDDKPPNTKKQYTPIEEEVYEIIKNKSVQEVLDIARKESTGENVEKLYRGQSLYQAIVDLNKQGKIELTIEEAKHANTEISNIDSYLLSIRKMRK